MPGFRGSIKDNIRLQVQYNGQGIGLVGGSVVWRGGGVVRGQLTAGLSDIYYNLAYVLMKIQGFM